MKHEKIISDSKTEGVTLFLSGAQIKKKSNISLEKGETTLIFTKLPYNIRPESIQVEVTGDHKIISTDHKINYLNTANATLDDIVQLNFYIKDVKNFRKGADVFREYFENGAPVRMTIVTPFIEANCLCQIDGVAYKSN